MASIIKVETLQDTAGNNSIDTQFVSSGSAKVYYNVSQVTGAVLTGSFNCGSVTDNGTGDFTVNFTNNLNNADDAAAPIGARNYVVQIHDSLITTSSVELYSRNSANAVNDQNLNTGAVYGSLA